MQQQRGEWIRNQMLLRPVIVQVQVIYLCLNNYYCILFFRCVITRTSAIVILAGLHLTVTANMQIYVKVQNTLLDLILWQLMCAAYLGGFECKIKNLVSVWNEGDLTLSGADRTGHTCLLNHSFSKKATWIMCDLIMTDLLFLTALILPSVPDFVSPKTLKYFLSSFQF